MERLLRFWEKIDKAEPLLRAAIRQLPNNPSAYNSLAQVYLRTEET